MNQNKMKAILEQISQRLENSLLHCDSIGLIKGKMGVAIFYLLYYKYTNNEYYEDLAIKLIEDIFDEIIPDFNMNYDSGLTGIATGLIYLLNNELVKGDNDEMLCEADQFIFYYLLNSSEDYLDGSLLTGICGIGKYYLYRVEHSKENLYNLRNKEFIIYVIDILEQYKFDFDKYKSDILNLLCKLYSLNIINYKIENLIRHYTDNNKTEIKKIVNDLLSIYKNKCREKIDSLFNLAFYFDENAENKELAWVGVSILAKMNIIDRNWIYLLV